LLLLSACLQSFLILLLPKLYTLTPAATLLTIRALNTLLVTTGIKHNHYMDGAVMKKSTAQPLDVNGDYFGPGHENIAVLLLGAKSNHPLGIFAHLFSIVYDYVEKMSRQMKSEKDQDNGCKSHMKPSLCPLPC